MAAVGALSIATCDAPFSAACCLPSDCAESSSVLKRSSGLVGVRRGGGGRGTASGDAAGDAPGDAAATASLPSSCFPSSLGSAHTALRRCLTPPFSILSFHRATASRHQGCSSSAAMLRRNGDSTSKFEIIAFASSDTLRHAASGS